MFYNLFRGGSMKDPIIFHIDVNNAFLSWTAIELLNNGYSIDIREIPSVIGGSEKSRHGIVLAKSPIAKKMGIKTAIPIYEAKKICKDLKVYPPDYNWYSEQSHKLMEYLKSYSPNMEQFSIDECFLDMTGTNYLYKDYIKLANDIKDDIKKKFGFTVNIGIAENKLCAKMASDFEKPNKVHTLFPDEIAKKMWPLDVGDLFMVGKSTTKELKKMGIKTIEDLARTDKKKLEKKFKSMSEYLHNASWGIDDSPVETERGERKSISTERTLAKDINDKEKLKDIIYKETLNITRQLRRKKLYAKTVGVIYKDIEFKRYSAQTTLDSPSNSDKEIYSKILEVFNDSYKEEPIRLIGVKVANLTDKKDSQISIFDIEEETNNNEEFQETIDKLNEKFGKSLIEPASLKLIDKKK